MSLKVAFIDSNINIGYISSIMNYGQTIGGIIAIKDNKVISSSSLLEDTLTHATLCTKIFLENVSGYFELFFINILDDHTLKTDTNSFLTALSWCLENKIDLINLSIGTTSLVDVSHLSFKINELVENGTVIVSASSNNNKMTFPASFDNVIGVKALKSKLKQTGFIYVEKSIDRIEVNCYVKNEIIEYNDKFYNIYCSNSYAAPFISAKICDFLFNGCNSLEQIKDRLKTNSLPMDNKSIKKNYKKYFVQKVNGPIIAVIGEVDNGLTSLLIQKFFLKFVERNYYGICLSEHFKTDLSVGILNIAESDPYHPYEKLKFYSHYSDASYIIIHANKKFLCNNIKLKNIDVILYDPALYDLKHKRGSKYIAFPEYKDFDVLFTKIYNDLSSI